LAGGTITLDGVEIGALDVAGRRRLGLRYITDERLGEGTVSPFSVAVNLVMKEIGAPELWDRGVSRWDRIHSHARERIGAFDIRTPSERTPLGRLSGGNIQKVLLARELGAAARVVIFNKPTYGLDLQNIRIARDHIRAGAEAGRATLLISTELDELIELCDRIGVMFQGRLTGVVDNAEGIEQRIGALMTGAEAAWAPAPKPRGRRRPPARPPPRRGGSPSPCCARCCRSCSRWSSAASSCCCFRPTRSLITAMCCSAAC